MGRTGICDVPATSSMGLFSHVQGAARQPRDHGRVAVVEELAPPLVEGGDGRQLLVGELEVEHVQVLGHSLQSHRLGDHHDAALDQPVQRGIIDPAGAPFNVARFVFLDGRARGFFLDWDEVADATVGALRCTTR